MSRRIRLTLLVLFASIALGTTACASPTGPRGDDCTLQGTNPDTHC